MRYLLDFFRNAKPRDLLFSSGYALYLVFGYMVSESPTLLSAAGELEHSTQTLFWLTEMAVRVVLFTLIASSVRHVLKVPLGVMATVTGITAVVACLVIGMVFQFSSALSDNVILPWLLFGGALLGFGDVLIVLLWARVSATLPLRTVYLFVLLCNVISLVVYLVVTLLPDDTSVPVAAVLFVVSVVGASRAIASREQRQWEYSRPVFDHAMRGIAQPLAGTAILFFMGGLMQQISLQAEQPLEEFQHMSLITSAIVILALLLPALLIKRPLNMGRMYALAIPLSAAGFLLLPLVWSGVSGIANSLVQLGSMVANIVLWCVLADMSRDTKLPPILLFAPAFACTNIAQFAGTLVGFLNADTLQQGHLVLTTVALVAAYLLFMVGLFLFRDKSTKGVELESQAGITQVDALLLRRSEEVSARYQLTAREGEILLLLAQGYTITVISEKLFVSENTVKSHVKSIYQKLDIHSRTDLLKLVNEE